MAKQTKMQAVKEGGKKTAGTVGGALTVFALWALEEYGGVELPQHVAGAVGVLIGGVVGWIGARR